MVMIVRQGKKAGHYMIEWLDEQPTKKGHSRTAKQYPAS